MRPGLAFLFILIGLSLQAQPLMLAGENYLELNGERFKNQKIVFTKANGDWYATINDGHGTLSFDGSYSGRPVRLDIEWDGGQKVHVITNDVRHQSRKGDFLITMPDKEVYGDGLNAYPERDQEMDITINSVDEDHVNGMISGSITQGNQKVAINGVFDLKRAVGQPGSKRIVTASYKNYDNAVHDKLVGAQNRSPSESEAQYDLDVRSALRDVLAPVVSQLEKEGWKVDNQTSLGPLTGVGRGTERDIFQSRYVLDLSLTPASPDFAYYRQRFDELSQQSAKNPSKQSFDEFVKFGYDMNGATKITILVYVNNHSMATSNYKGGMKLSRTGDNSIKIQSSYVAARTGGGIDGAIDATFILAGNWNQPVIQKAADGSEQVKAIAILDPAASHLKMQNVLIRMECNAKLADEISSLLEVQKLCSTH